MDAPVAPDTILVPTPEPEVAEKIEEAQAQAQDTPIIFLDIDGVMISGTQLLVDIDSCDKRIFPATTIAVIRELCTLTGAKVVINSTHNQPHSRAPNILAALNIAGLDPSHFHPTDPNTRYPDLERPLAITEWLARHPETKRWLAIDDSNCADEEHMILVDSMAGVTVNELNDALTRWGHNPIIILM